VTVLQALVRVVVVGSSDARPASLIALQDRGVGEGHP
jgi:hypothetical protein